MSKVIRDCSGLTELCSVIGPENSQHPLNQLNAKNHRNLVTCVFPRFKQFACFRFEFSLVNDDVNLCSDWSLGIFWFQFFDTQLKTSSVVINVVG